MAQVHGLLTACTAHADSPCFQLAVTFRVISTCSVHCSLRHPSSTISHRIRCHHQHFCTPKHAQHRSSPPAHPLALLALYLDAARSSQRHTCSPHFHSVSHHTRCLWPLFRSPSCPQCLSTPPSRLYGFQARYSTQHVRLINTLIRDASRASLVVMELTLCSHLNRRALSCLYI